MSILFQTTFALIAVLVVILGCAYLLRRLQGVSGGQANLIKVKAMSSLGPREKIALIEVSGQWILVGVAQSQVNHIATLPFAPDTMSEEVPDIKFNAKSWLESYLKNPEDYMQNMEVLYSKLLEKYIV